ncbi:hypothetical protein NIES2119_26720 [[Phormidium ambiguum] IAM M-71]|uniref:Uncharacterized protein n=1 Tax=[Phormidium ambiguum] IAM M-71 TaxID=454136 RepID=A0A1U7I7G2_9CYAN|nr:hypothetical protein [Phormidium ambiguum]OKH32273.1 hypothetical protein NIES2119_26720 [Phormidium ambiguum IAM M-71]
MFAIEFQANIQNGFIEIPEEYKQQFQQEKSIKVILLKDEQSPNRDMIAHLLDNPIQVNEFIPIKRDEIYE